MDRAGSLVYRETLSATSAAGVRYFGRDQRMNFSAITTDGALTFAKYLEPFDITLQSLCIRALYATGVAFTSTLFELVSLCGEMPHSLALGETDFRGIVSWHGALRLYGAFGFYYGVPDTGDYTNTITFTAHFIDHSKGVAR